MIEPTIGRIVWFYQGKAKANNIADNGDQPMTAQIIYVHNPRLVSLDITDHRGTHHSKAKVKLMQGDEDFTPVEDWCEWMPFQKGQAAKTDQPPERKA